MPNEVFSKFNNADVKFGKVKRENGQEDELTNGNFATFMESHDRAVRKAAFEALYKQYGAYINTIAAAFYGIRWHPHFPAISSRQCSMQTQGVTSQH